MVAAPIVLAVFAVPAEDWPLEDPFDRTNIIRENTSVMNRVCIYKD